MTKKIILSFFVLVGLTSCKPYLETAQKNKITVMTFNVENLFDTKDDPGKKDETFLPVELKQNPEHKKLCEAYRFKSWQDICLYWDWSESALQFKLGQLAKVISAVDSGQGPDILILQEVENISVLRELLDSYLPQLQFSTVALVEGDDARGIDVAVVSRLKQVGASEISYVPFKEIPQGILEDTRGILQVDLELPNKEILTVFANHFPAPFHEYKYREETFEYLNALKKQLPADRLIVAAGDLNIPSDEDREQKMFERFASLDWLVSHQEGCQGCKGTAYYPPKNSWSFLDVIMLSKNFETSKTWQLDRNSIQVFKIPEHMTAEGTPHDFDAEKLTGISDHWPVILDIVL